MKKQLVFACIVLSLAIGFAGFGFARKTTANRTEEYAIISVFQEGKRNYVSITVGSAPTQEKEFQKEKTAKQYDLAPVIREMEKLNEQGFELINSSTSIVPFDSGTGFTGGSPFYTFTFKRKAKK